MLFTSENVLVSMNPSTNFLQLHVAASIHIEVPKQLVAGRMTYSTRYTNTLTFFGDFESCTPSVTNVSPRSALPTESDSDGVDDGDEEEDDDEFVRRRRAYF